VGASFHTEVAQDGSVSFSAKELGLEVADQVQMDFNGPAAIETKDVTFTGDPGSAYSLSASTLRIVLETSLEISAPLVKITGGTIMLSDDANGAVIDGLAFLLWLIQDFQVVGGKLALPSVVAFLKTLNWKVLV
jgi:hypothetical protein